MAALMSAKKISEVLDFFQPKRRGRPPKPGGAQSAAERKRRQRQRQHDWSWLPFPDPFDDEILIGKSNQLVLQHNGQWVNIKAILPLPDGAKPPVAPAGFVRAAVRAKNDAEMQALNQRVVAAAVAARQAEQAQAEPEEILI